MSATPSGQGARPEPVADAGWSAAAATVFVGAAVHVLSSWGWLVPEWVSEAATEYVELAVVTAAGALSSLVAAHWSRRRVTPLADPRDQDGRPLLRQVPDDPPEHDADHPRGPRVDIAALVREYGL